jgi:hypothetical protein
VVFNIYLVFSINTMSVSDSHESCTSSHCLRAVRTCGARRHHVVHAYSSCVILVLSRVVRACGSHALSHVVCVRRMYHLHRSLALPLIVRTFLTCRSRVCRSTSAHDNKLFSLTNTHVNNVTMSGHIF